MADQVLDYFSKYSNLTNNSSAQPTVTNTTPTQTITNTVTNPVNLSSVSAPSTVTGEELATGSPEAVITPDLNTAQSTVQSANKVAETAKMTIPSIQSIVDSYKKPTEAETKREGLSTQLEAALNEIKGAGQALVDEQARLGVPEQVKKLQDVNLQIANLAAAYDKGLVDIEGKPIPMQFITGQQAQMQRQRAIELGSLTSVAQALQGNISLAKQTAQETINAKYADKQVEIDNLKTLLDLNYQNLTSAEKKRADALNLELGARQEELDKQKLIDTGIQNIMIQAAENGAPADILNKIRQSTDVQRAILNAGTYLSKQTSGAPTKIGTDSKGKDLFFYNNDIVTGDELLGKFGGTNDTIMELSDPVAYDWAVSIRDGKSKLSDITGDPDLKNRVIAVQKTLPPSESAIKNAEQMITSLETLIKHSGLDSAVGPTGAGRALFALGDAWGNRDAFLGLANQLISSKALDALIKAKEDGATFGALSESELAMLRSSASALGAWAETKEGRITKFDVDEKTFKTEINKLITEYKGLVEKAKDPLQLFQQPLSRGEKGSDVSGIKDFSRVKTVIGTGTATGITGGSSAWKYGLDLVLDGGKGAPVKTPYSGTVIMAKNDGGFGNSVKIKLDNGEVIRLSHLDSFKVKPGQRITSGTVVGGQGNTGTVIKVGKGGTGTHVDITLYDKNGKPYSSQEVASKLNTQLV